MNKYAWFALRSITWLVVALGLALYSLLLFISIIEWRQSPYIHTSRSAEADFIFFEAILGSGLPPLMIALYFFGRCNKPVEWVMGSVYFAIFFFWHYLSFIFLAHGTWHTYVPLLLTELIAVACVIWWSERYRSHLIAIDGR